MNQNSLGLTFDRWLAAAHETSSMKTRFAWQNGIDPTDYRCDADRRKRLGSGR